MDKRRSEKDGEKKTSPRRPASGSASQRRVPRGTKPGSMIEPTRGAREDDTQPVTTPMVVSSHTTPIEGIVTSAPPRRDDTKSAVQRWQDDGGDFQPETLEGAVAATSATTTATDEAGEAVRVEAARRLDDAALDATRILLSYADGALTIGGTVDTDGDRARVRAALADLPGVSRVIDRVRVAPADPATHA